MPDVFISYPNKAARDASLLASELQTRGVTTWFASRDLRTQTDWKSKVREALHNAEAVVFLVTPDSEPSPSVRDEYMSALESYWAGKKKVLIPLLVGRDADAPGFLRQWASLRVEKPSDWGRAADKVADWLRAYGTSRSQPTKEQRAEWHQRLRNIDRRVGELQQVTKTKSRGTGVASKKSKSSNPTKSREE